MWGLTDSVQLDKYHLQTYCIGVNRSVLCLKEWYRFWLGFSPVGSKLALVERGEIGITQEMLQHGTEITAHYSLTRLLTESSSVGEELAGIEVGDIRCINPTVFAWKSLLDIGFPFIKKQVLFEPCEGRVPKMVSLSEIKKHLPVDADSSKILHDIQQLMQSRFLRRSGI